MTTARDKRLEKAQLKVLFQVPFFAPGVAKLPIEWSDKVPTAATDGKRIYWNPAFFDSLEDQQLVTVLCHEVMHPMLGHLWRTPPGADHETWNEACDHAVNLALKEFGQQVMAKRLADPFPFPKDLPICADPAYAGMAEEVIYQRLAQRPKGKGGKAGQGGQGKPGWARQPFGEFIQSPGDPAQQKASKTDWEHTLIQSCELNKGRGELPTGMARAVGELLDPKVPWWELLRQWLREQADDDWSWQRPNRYYDGEFILPSLYSEKIGSVVFGVDTSGSIDHEMLRKFKGEMQGCLDEMKPAKLVEICADTKIHSEREYRAGETVSMDAPGGGGTSFVEVLRRCEDMQPVPKCLVYLTDLDGEFGKVAPSFPTLWVTYGTDEKAPFGETIKAS